MSTESKMLYEPDVSWQIKFEAMVGKMPDSFHREDVGEYEKRMHMDYFLGFLITGVGLGAEQLLTGEMNAALAWSLFAIAGIGLAAHNCDKAVEAADRRFHRAMQRMKS